VTVIARSRQRSGHLPRPSHSEERSRCRLANITLPGVGGPLNGRKRVLRAVPHLPVSSAADGT
jgi:hypothetical protein